MQNVNDYSQETYKDWQGCCGANRHLPHSNILIASLIDPEHREKGLATNLTNQINYNPKLDTINKSLEPLKAIQNNTVISANQSTGAAKTLTSLLDEVKKINTALAGLNEIKTILNESKTLLTAISNNTKPAETPTPTPTPAIEEEVE